MVLVDKKKSRECQVKDISKCLLAQPNFSTFSQSIVAINQSSCRTHCNNDGTEYPNVAMAYQDDPHGTDYCRIFQSLVTLYRNREVVGYPAFRYKGQKKNISNLENLYCVKQATSFACQHNKTKVARWRTSLSTLLSFPFQINQNSTILLHLESSSILHPSLPYYLITTIH